MNDPHPTLLKAESWNPSGQHRACHVVIYCFPGQALMIETGPWCGKPALSPRVDPKAVLFYQREHKAVRKLENSSLKTIHVHGESSHIPNNMHYHFKTNSLSLNISGPALFDE